MTTIIVNQTAGSNEIPPQLITGFATGKMVEQAGVRRPFYFDDTRFSLLARHGLVRNGVEVVEDVNRRKQSTKASATQQLKNASLVMVASGILRTALMEKLARTLHTSTTEIDANRMLHSYGVDSLVAIELRKWIQQELNTDVSMFEILADDSILELSQKLAARSHLPSNQRRNELECYDCMLQVTSP